MSKTHSRCASALGLLVLITGCGATPTGKTVAATAAPQARETTKGDAALPMPMPPIEPCVFPTLAELGQLRDDSAAVVLARVGAAVIHDVNGSATTTHSLTVQKVVRGTLPDGAEVLVQGGVPVPLLQARDYVLFLGATSLPTDFYVVNGLKGAFPVTQGRAARECGNPANASNRPSADTTADSDVFTAEINEAPALKRSNK